MKRINYIFILMMLFVLASCEQTLEYDEVQVNNPEGEWTVKAYINGKNVFGSFPIKTYTSSLGKDSLNINDLEGQFWNFNVKAAVETSANSFQTQHSINTIPNYGIGVKVLNGKIINNDSIYFEIQFENDEIPYGISYQLKGHRTK